MQPIGPLMHEHRLIERMVALLGREFGRLERGEDPDLRFLDHAVDFIRHYADVCHHGKEEDILFREVLAKEDMDKGLRELTHRLTKEHAYGRELTAALDRAARARRSGGGAESVRDIMDALRKLGEFYPRHIRTEDKEYFHQIMRFFAADEQKAMLREFDEFERRVFHERYRRLVEEHEGETAGVSPQTQGRKP